MYLEYVETPSSAVRKRRNVKGYRRIRCLARHAENAGRAYGPVSADADLPVDVELSNARRLLAGKLRGPLQTLAQRPPRDTDLHHRSELVEALIDLLE